MELLIETVLFLAVVAVILLGVYLGRNGIKRFFQRDLVDMHTSLRSELEACKAELHEDLAKLRSEICLQQQIKSQYFTNKITTYQNVLAGLLNFQEYISTYNAISDPKERQAFRMHPFHYVNEQQNLHVIYGGYLFLPSEPAMQKVAQSWKRILDTMKANELVGKSLLEEHMENIQKLRKVMLSDVGVELEGKEDNQST